MQNDEVLEFIRRRFGKCEEIWTDGNCYYFAVILKDRFPQGELFYDVIYGHFVVLIGTNFYDCKGKRRKKGKLIRWDDFEKYDALRYQRIIRDCIK